MKELPVLFSANAVADAGGVVGVGIDACLLVDIAPIERRELPVLMAVGAAVRLHESVRAGVVCRVDRPGSVIIPGLVNAHTHLDLTHIGPRPHDPDEGFMSWVDMVRSCRETSTAGISESVRVGIELSRRGGTVAVGDIAGAPGGKPSLVPYEVLGELGMLGVSFVEFFAIGKGMERGCRAAEEVVGHACGPRGPSPVPASRERPLPGGEGGGEGGEGGGEAGLRLGLQPHALNTVGLAGYRWAVEVAREHGLPLSTHLAETWEEREFVGRASGPQRELLERLGLWDVAMLEEIGRGKHPVEHMRDILGEAPFLVAHVNDADDAAIGTLARTGTSVAYCPRASAYFGAERRFAAHRYRDMMAAGIRVALGTDSMVNLDTPGRISVLDEMRLLFRRDGTDPRILLEMGTVNGAAALGLNTEWFRLGEALQRIAGLVSVEEGEGEGSALDRTMGSSGDPVLLLDRNYCCETRIEPI